MTVSFQSQQWQCGLCCVEETTTKLVYCDSFLPQQWQCGLCCVTETTAKLVYCDSFLPITAVTMWSVLCYRNHSQTSLLWQFPPTAVTMQLLLLPGPVSKAQPRLLFVGCLTSQQHASVSQGRICSDNFTCCHTETEVANQTFSLTQSQYTDTGPTSLSTDPATPGAWQGSHWSANFKVTGMTRSRKNPGASGIRTRDLPLSRRTP